MFCRVYAVLKSQVKRPTPDLFCAKLHRLDDSIQIIVCDFQFRRPSAALADRLSLGRIPEDLLSWSDVESAGASS